MRQYLVLVDTSAWICFFARRGFPEIKEAVTRFLDENRVAIAGPVIIELIQGCRDETEKKEMEECLRGLHHLAIMDEHWHQAARLAFDLRRKGVTVSAIDVLIAATAMTYHCLLLHQDQDYDLMVKYYPVLKTYNPHQA
ncbi:MAG: PIN domain-containing protein [Nitrospirota bacterium]